MVCGLGCGRCLGDRGRGLKHCDGHSRQKPENQRSAPASCARRRSDELATGEPVAMPYCGPREGQIIRICNFVRSDLNRTCCFVGHRSSPLQFGDSADLRPTVAPLWICPESSERWPGIAMSNRRSFIICSLLSSFIRNCNYSRRYVRLCCRLPISIHRVAPVRSF